MFSDAIINLTTNIIGDNHVPILINSLIIILMGSGGPINIMTDNNGY